jgi:hypothetical protein
MTPAASGPQLFAHYAFGPNRLGLCGPDDWESLQVLGASGADDQGLRELARGFEGAYPYLELLSSEAGIADPLDPAVVRAYWLGTELPHAVSERALGRSLEERFRARVARKDWRWIAGKPNQGARPVHAFHVLDVFPRVGLLRGERLGDALPVMDRCRIRWGRVLDVSRGRVTVSAPALELVQGKLRIGPAETVSLQRWPLAPGDADDLKAGDIVSFHWDWLCDRLGRSGLDALQRSTRNQIEIANRTI